MDIVVEGREIKAVAQLMKQAIAYTLDRLTGEPVRPIVERPVLGSDTPGEWLSPSRPFATRAGAGRRARHVRRHPHRLRPELRAEAIEDRRSVRARGDLQPPSIRGDGDGDRKGTLQLRGSVGGAEWAGAGFDPETGMLYVSSATGTFAADLCPGNRDQMSGRYTRGTRVFPQGPRGVPLLRRRTAASSPST